MKRFRQRPSLGAESGMDALPHQLIVGEPEARIIVSDHRAAAPVLLGRDRHQRGQP